MCMQAKGLVKFESKWDLLHDEIAEWDEADGVFRQKRRVFDDNANAESEVVLSCWNLKGQ